jgi:hypothetical protein
VLATDSAPWHDSLHGDLPCRLQPGFPTDWSYRARGTTFFLAVRAVNPWPLGNSPSLNPPVAELSD